MMTNNMPSDRVRRKRQIIQKFLGENAENALIMRKTHLIMWKFQKLTEVITKPFQCTEQ